MEHFLKTLTELGTTYGLKIIYGLVILFVGMKLCKFAASKIEKSKAFKKLDDGVETFVISSFKIVFAIALISSVAFLWGIPTTAFVTLFTSAGVAIGLAVQGALGNFAGGLMILIFKPFKVGDYIECASGSGTVKKITVIYTFLLTPDNKVVTIPNGTLTNATVTNFSKKPERRVDLVISAGYDDDIDKVESILLEVANGCDKVLKNPAPLARLASHAESSLQYNFRVWCKSADYWDVYYYCTEEVRKAFQKNGISIPYKQIDIHNVD